MSKVPAGTLNLDPNDRNSLFCHFAVVLAGRPTWGLTAQDHVVTGKYTPSIRPDVDGGMAQFGFPDGALVAGPFWGPHSGTQDTLQAASDRGLLKAYGMFPGDVATLGDFNVAQWVASFDGAMSLLKWAWTANLPYENNGTAKEPDNAVGTKAGSVGSIPALSSPEQRAEELRLIAQQMCANRLLELPERFYYIAETFLWKNASWLAVKPLVVNAIDAYRRARRDLGLETRPIPPLEQ